MAPNADFLRASLVLSSPWLNNITLNNINTLVVSWTELSIYKTHLSNQEPKVPMAIPVQVVSHSLHHAYFIGRYITAHLYLLQVHQFQVLRWQESAHCQNVRAAHSIQKHRWECRGCSGLRKSNQAVTSGNFWQFLASTDPRMSEVGTALRTRPPIMYSWPPRWT